ncbi:MAG TPA: hypothetical protein PLQ67_03760 [Burkholderiaceae bacterium]|nr:hypothetical protein [Burkholderiaceae bacterium]
MSTLNELAEQHIRESEARLKRIDEMMAQGRNAPARSADKPNELDALLDRLQSERDLLAAELAHIRSLPLSAHEEAKTRSQGVRGLLDAIGLQLERVLTAIFEQDKRS